MSVILRTQHLGIAFGGLHAVEDFNIEIYKGELVGLIGPNGAGKTTTLHTIYGLLKATQGEILLDDVNLQKVPNYKIIDLGMSQVLEGRHVFAQMTVLENLYMGAYTVKNKEQVDKNIEWVYTHFPRLKERSKQLAGTLSGGEQQMLAIGRAMMTNPKILLMDEPSMGLSPLLVSEIFAIIEELHKDGITILLVEQNAKMALSIADRAYVLENGRITMSGDAKELLTDERIKKAYLGA